MECPLINRSFTPIEEYNKRCEYSPLGSDEVYVYYEHDDGFGKKSKVQFCQLIGRKRDIFQCFNESEWKRCPRYRAQAIREADDA